MEDDEQYEPISDLTRRRLIKTGLTAATLLALTQFSKVYRMFMSSDKSKNVEGITEEQWNKGILQIRNALEQSCRNRDRGYCSQGEEVSASLELHPFEGVDNKALLPSLKQRFDQKYQNLLELKIIEPSYDSSKSTMTINAKILAVRFPPARTIRPGHANM